MIGNYKYMYTDLYLQDKRQRNIPKVFWVGIFALFGLVASQMYFWYASVPAKASEISVSRLYIADITSSSLGIFVETEEPVTMYAIYGENENQLTNTVGDRLDSPQDLAPRRYHYFSFVDLVMGRTYKYRLVTDKRLIEYNGKTLFEIKLNGDASLQIGQKRPIYGKVVVPNGAGLSEATLVFRQSGGMNNKIFTTVTKSTGEWLYSLPSSFLNEDIINVEVVHENHPHSQIKALVSKSSPMPQSVVIGSDYVFSETENVLGTTAKREDASNGPENFIVSILYPANNAIIPDTRPLFKGYGIPGTSVSLEVNSRPPYLEKGIVDERGVWHVDPKNPFLAGSYTLVVKIQDSTKVVRTLSRNFVIAKSGEQVLGLTDVSTPSGTLAPTKITVTQAPLVTIITQSPIFEATPTPAELVEAGIGFPTWLPLVGLGFVLLGFLFIRESNDYLS